MRSLLAAFWWFSRDLCDLSELTTSVCLMGDVRYENCANGGHFKGLALARRFTFVTTNDNAGSSVNYRQTHGLNSHALNSVQLKCDLQVGGSNLNYTLRSCLLGSWLLAMPDALDILHNSAYKAHIELYKAKQRPILRGGSVFHVLPFPDGANYDGTLLWFSMRFRTVADLYTSCCTAAMVVLMFCAVAA